LIRELVPYGSRILINGRGSASCFETALHASSSHEAQFIENTLSLILRIERPSTLRPHPEETAKPSSRRRGLRLRMRVSVSKVEESNRRLSAAS
jgi:hypothetical protein